MPSLSSGKLSRILRRFRRNKRGSAAIEFGIVALPFFVMLFAIFEFALMFLAGEVLATASQDSARLIFTNQAQDQKFDALAFKKDLCARLGNTLFDCQAGALDKGVMIDVKVVPQFTTVSASDLAPPIDANGELTGLSYTSPPPGSTVIVRTFYKWPLLVNFDGYSLASVAGQQFRYLTATAAFRVEPGGRREDFRIEPDEPWPFCIALFERSGWRSFHRILVDLSVAVGASVWHRSVYRGVRGVTKSSRGLTHDVGLDFPVYECLYG